MALAFLSNIFTLKLILPEYLRGTQRRTQLPPSTRGWEMFFSSNPCLGWQIPIAQQDLLRQERRLGLTAAVLWGFEAAS